VAISKQKKEEILKDLSSVIGESGSIVFVNFHGLSVDDANDLRRTLSEKGVDYRVIKKTLAKKAFTESKIKGELPELPGELAIAWGDDPVVPAGSIYGFQKSLDGAVSILGGVYEGEYKDQASMMEIALIPPMETLRGMFVNIINSPIQRFAIALGQIAEKKAA
jgi:large subunit ribosomal protein L10